MVAISLSGLLKHLAARHGLAERVIAPHTANKGSRPLAAARWAPAPNLTRPEIAGNTVNTHIRRMYAKLGATDRS